MRRRNTLFLLDDMPPDDDDHAILDNATDRVLDLANDFLLSDKTVSDLSTVVQAMAAAFPWLADDDDDQPLDYEFWLANAEPQTMTIREYVGSGDDAVERDIDVEVGPNYPTREQVFG